MRSDDLRVVGGKDGWFVGGGGGEVVVLEGDLRGLGQQRGVSDQLSVLEGGCYLVAGLLRSTCYCLSGCFYLFFLMF